MGCKTIKVESKSISPGIITDLIFIYNLIVHQVAKDNYEQELKNKLDINNYFEQLLNQLELKQNETHLNRAAQIIAHLIPR